jgi:hypothetical protein
MARFCCADRVQGYDAFLRKPFKLMEISRLITDLLKNPP